VTFLTVRVINSQNNLPRVEGPITFQKAAAGFGQTVVQFGSASTGGLIVGAPLQMRDMNETGKVYKCDPSSGQCQEIQIQSRGTLCCGVCGPTVHQACGENMYVKGYCFLLDQSLQQLRHIPDSLPECPKRPTDIVFLIDGSGSINSRDFETMKTFVIEVIRRFHGTDTLFALMQFSSIFQEHFDFNKFKSTHNIDSLVHQVRQLEGATYTAKAIQKVVKELFVSWKGSRDGAARILIVVTDEAERAGIIRYAIGVGNAFSWYHGQQELHEIASNPTDEHIFQVNDFDALRGIQNQLQEKIFAIEGTQSQSGSSFQLEMSQDGFSSLLSPDGPVLGVVGAYDWSGGVYVYGSSREPSFMNVSRTSGDMKDAYLGYSVQVITSQGRSSYAVGAPRHNHIGKVILFRQDDKHGGWRMETEVLGEQVGSYFGGTLCAVDLDRDGNTDLVLIGAPMYYTPLNGGRVYICPINQQAEQAFGRFGASMSEIGDISGDRLMDVAIGAPMENDNHGALYIFHGEKRGLSPQYRQRIEGSLFPSRLHYFGQAVSGGTDLTRDGLPDIAVGAQGQVLLLRSRPVLKVVVSISFQPPTIPTSAFDCQGQEQLNTEASMAEVCFTITKSNSISSTIQYSLALDPGRTKIRAAFDTTSPVLSKELQLGIETRCEKYRITLPLCPEDTVTPITLRLNYTLTGEPITAAGSLRPILSEDSAQGTSWRKLTPFCPLSLSILVVGVTPELNTTVSIQNRGENSYSTTVRFFYPAALSYRRVVLLQVPQHNQSNRRAVAVRCSSAVGSEEQTQRNSTCHVNHPIFWSGAEVGTDRQRVGDWAGGGTLAIDRPRPSWPCWAPAHPLPHLAISFHPQDCSVATCKKIRCRIASLEMQQPLEFMIKGSVSFQWVSQTQQQKVSLVSEAQIDYEEKKYTQKEGFVQRQVQTVVERSEVYNYLPIIVGSSVGGLVLLALITAALYKWDCLLPPRMDVDTNKLHITPLTWLLTFTCTYWFKPNIPIRHHVLPSLSDSDSVCSRTIAKECVYTVPLGWGVPVPAFWNVFT
uniref:VWFA domain-containing protein n=1 Tax=Chelonoidis abingdonii TaxID=106734 RepID=A0A8C0INB8_CHEAB